MSAGALFCAPWGADSNPGTAAAPFATLAKTQIATRRIAGTVPLTVYVRGIGARYLNTSLSFSTAQDGGTAACPVVWRGYPSDPKPVISGGVVVSGWILHDAGKNIWQAPLPAGVPTDVRQLYINGTLASRTRLQPLLGSFSWLIDGLQSTLKSTILGLARPQDLWVIYTITGFIHQEFPVTAVATLPDPWCKLTINPAAWQTRYVNIINKNQPVALENAYEFLAPGTFYINPSAGPTLYYVPLPGQDMTTADVVVPKIGYILSVSGNADYLTFQDFSFQHGYFAPDPNWGYNVSGGDAYLGPYSQTAIIPVAGPSPYPLTFGNLPGTVHVAGPAEQISFIDCEGTRNGTTCLHITDNAGGITVDGCDFHDTSSNGVIAGSNFDIFRADLAANPMHDITMINNSASNVGLTYPSSVPYGASNIKTFTFERNNVNGVPYCGTLFGHTNVDIPCQDANWRIRYNIIRNTNQNKLCWDGGAIYISGENETCDISYNYLQTALPTDGALYFDAGNRGLAAGWCIIISNGTSIYNNGGLNVTQRYNFCRAPTAVVFALSFRLAYNTRGGSRPAVYGNQDASVGPYPYSILGQIANVMAAVNGAGGPTAPRNLQLTRSATNPNAVTLAWTAPVNSGMGGLAGYEVWLDGNVVGTTPAGTTQYSFTFLQPNTAHTFQVVAMDSAILYQFPDASGPGGSGGLISVGHLSQPCPAALLITGAETPIPGSIGNVPINKFSPFVTTAHGPPPTATALAGVSTIVVDSSATDTNGSITGTVSAASDQLLTLIFGTLKSTSTYTVYLSGTVADGTGTLYNFSVTPLSQTQSGFTIQCEPAPIVADAALTLAYLII